ncbi:MAG: hypothetical protein Q4F81_05510 [Eubacteriales bacterium]|nr:hypothetical protein [Eubacteriales bacterium]
MKVGSYRQRNGKNGEVSEGAGADEHVHQVPAAQRGYERCDAHVLHSDLDEPIRRAMGRDFGERVALHFLEVPESR